MIISDTNKYMNTFCTNLTGNYIFLEIGLFDVHFLLEYFSYSIIYWSMSIFIFWVWA